MAVVSDLPPHSYLNKYKIIPFITNTPFILSILFSEFIRSCRLGSHLNHTLIIRFTKSTQRLVLTTFILLFLRFIYHTKYKNTLFDRYLFKPKRMFKSSRLTRLSSLFISNFITTHQYFWIILVLIRVTFLILLRLHLDFTRIIEHLFAMFIEPIDTEQLFSYFRHLLDSFIMFFTRNCFVKSNWSNPILMEISPRNHIWRTFFLADHTSTCFDSFFLVTIFKFPSFIVIFLDYFFSLFIDLFLPEWSTT